MKLSQERNVRSLAKNTLGSTRVGRAMRLPGPVWSSGWEDILRIEIVEERRPKRYVAP